LKIIYYSPHPTHDIVSEVGYSTHQRETIHAMRALGHTVFPVILGGTEKGEVDIYHKRITTPGSGKQALVKLLPKFLLNTLKDLLVIRHDRKAAARLKQAIQEIQPDLVYERNEYMQDKGTLLCRAMNQYHILEINSPVVEEMRAFEGPSLLHFLAWKKEKNKIRNTNKILVVSSALQEYVKNKFHSKAPILVVPNCINPEIPVPDAGSIHARRSAMGWNGKTIFGFVGSIFPYHGVDKLIQAFAQVVVQYPEARLLVVGGGRMLDSCKKLAADMLPENTCAFAGKVPHAEVMEYIGMFDIAIMPDSNWYGSPVKILEYGWMQKPIIAPDLAPLRDIMVHEQDGFLTSADPGALALAMGKAMDEVEKFAQMGKAFHQKIREHYTWEKQVRSSVGDA
jgi:glycosyltransferase involved in cell wall biosynthesis